MKKVLIVNKSYSNKTDFDTRFMHDSGPIYNNDRFFSIAQQTFDAHIKKKSRGLFAFMNWWFFTTNYKLSPDVSKAKKSWKAWLVDIFFWSCIIALFACILAGVAKPVIESIIKTVLLAQNKYSGDLVINGHVIATNLKASGSDVLSGNSGTEQFEYIPQVWSAHFRDPKVYVPMIFILILFFFSFIYIYRERKIKPRTNKMSNEEYLIARMNMINFFKWILKRKVPLVEGIKEYNHRIIFNMSADYSIMRIMNYIYSGLKEMNIIMVTTFDDDNKIFELQKTIKQDFDNLDVIIVSEETTKKLDSIYQNGILNDKIKTINISNQEKDKNQDIIDVNIH